MRTQFSLTSMNFPIVSSFVQVIYSWVGLQYMVFGWIWECIISSNKLTLVKIKLGKWMGFIEKDKSWEIKLLVSQSVLRKNRTTMILFWLEWQKRPTFANVHQCFIYALGMQRDPGGLRWRIASLRWESVIIIVHPSRRACDKCAPQGVRG